MARCRYICGRRHGRVGVAVVIFVCLSFWTAYLVTWDRIDQYRHHLSFEPPRQALNIVHGKKIGHGPPSLYPLTPFPYSPKESSNTNDLDDHDEVAGGLSPHHPWLAAVISAVGDTERRRQIRSTWMHLFRDLPYDCRFVVANPGPRLVETIVAENRSFGDLIVLENIQEDDITANTVKTLELYRWLIANRRDAGYEFVTKLDTDMWLNARAFWDRFLAPMMTSHKERKERTAGGASPREVNATMGTVIGELYYARKSDLVFPHGSMYTLSWDLIELLAHQYEISPVRTGEDMAIAILLMKAGVRARFLNFKASEKFDFDPRDTRHVGEAWARQGTHPSATLHALVPGNEAIAIHELKDKALWDMVAGCFGEAGMLDMPPSEGPERTPPWSLRWWDLLEWSGLGHPYRARIERIPDFLWTQENGSWVCDGIWDLGPRDPRLKS